MAITNQTPEQKEIQFFLELKRELALQHEKEAVELVTLVLQSLRQTISLQNADMLLNKLPDFLRLVFASNWKHNERQIEVRHLDEFVSLVMSRDQKSLFKDEIKTLSAIILILNRLYKMIGLENFEGLNPSLAQELNNIMAQVEV